MAQHPAASPQEAFKKAMQELPAISFSYNYNNKLYSDVFTTCRLKSSKFDVGNTYKIILKEKQICTAEITHIIGFKLWEVPSCLTMIDAGVNPPDFATLMHKIYAKHVTDWNAQQLYFLFLKKHRQTVNF